MDIQEPPCVVEGISHAWVPQTYPITYPPGGALARCGRSGCALVRHVNADGLATYWRPAKLQPQD